MGIHEYLLSNGLKVILKKTDFKKHTFQFSAFSEGGSSVESDADYFNSLATATVMQQSGYADYSTDDLRKINAGKIASVWATINPYYENISGNGIQEDMDTVFELIYLAFTQPRIDENIFNNYKRDLHQYIEAKKSHPDQVYNDELVDFFYDKHLRVTYFKTAAEIESLNMVQLKEIYARRFNNAAEFTFVFVGDINQQQFEKNLNQYLAALPAKKQPVEHYKNLHINDKQGSHTFLSQKNPENRSNVILYSSKATKFTQKKLMLAEAVSHILSVKLNESVREENANVYSVNINTNITRVPEEKFMAMSVFSCAPEKTTATIALIKNVVEGVKKTGFEQKQLDNYILMVEKEYQKSLKKNNFWLSHIESSLKHQDPLDNILQQPARVKTITLQELQQFVKDYLSFDNYLQSIFTTADYQ